MQNGQKTKTGLLKLFAIRAKVDTPFFPIKSPFTSKASPLIKILVTMNSDRIKIS